MLSPIAMPPPAFLVLNLFRYLPQVIPRDVTTYTFVLYAFVLCSIYLGHYVK